MRGENLLYVRSLAAQLEAVSQRPSDDYIFIYGY
jgi:hypothetical protein